MTLPRPVVIHYHLFKNAGSSIDVVLQRNFAERWVTYDGANPAGRLTQDQLREFIASHPEVAAVSSHQAFLPAPDMPGIHPIPFIVLRHPIDRVGSVYAFERQRGHVSDIAKFAAEHTLGEYVQYALDKQPLIPIKNYHMIMLQIGGNAKPIPFHAGSVDDAFARLCALPFFGLVERFDTTLRLLEENLRPHFPAFSASNVHENVTTARAATLDERIGAIKAELGPELYDRLLEYNRYDMELYERASAYFDRHWHNAACAKAG